MVEDISLTIFIEDASELSYFIISLESCMLEDCKFSLLEFSKLELICSVFLISELFSLPMLASKLSIQLELQEDWASITISCENIG